MIVARNEAETALLGISSFNQYLDNVENVLHKMERYSLKLNVQIGDIKKMVATNRRVIARLNENEERMKLLLEDSPNSLVNQVESWTEVKLKGNVENRCHLRRTCKVTNIREISWTHCKSSTNDGLTNMDPQEKSYRKAKMLLTSLEKDLLRKRGGEGRQSSFGVTQHQALIDKVNFIVKVVENLELNKNTVKRVNEVCKHVLTAMFDRQNELSSNGPEMQKSGRHRTHEEQKESLSYRIPIYKNRNGFSN